MSCHAEQSEASLYCVDLSSNAFGDVANARWIIANKFALQLTLLIFRSLATKVKTSFTFARLIEKFAYSQHSVLKRRRFQLQTHSLGKAEEQVHVVNSLSACSLEQVVND